MDKPTFEDIVFAHSGFIHRTLAQLGVRSPDLDDVAQEVLRGVARGLAAFDPALAAAPDDAVTAWLFGICDRQAASYRRTHRRLAALSREIEALPGGPSAEPCAEDRCLSAERVSVLLELIGKLESSRRAVVVAYAMEERPMSEVARSLGVPLNTAWNRLRLGIQDLREAFAARAMAAARARHRGKR